jgi:hypothetical protein
MSITNHIRLRGAGETVCAAANVVRRGGRRWPKGSGLGGSGSKGSGPMGSGGTNARWSGLDPHHDRHRAHSVQDDVPSRPDRERPRPKQGGS